MAEARNVPVEILLDTTVNGTEYKAGQPNAKMTAFEAQVSVRDKAARIIDVTPVAAPAPSAPATAAKGARKAPAKAATKKSARRR